MHAQSPPPLVLGVSAEALLTLAGPEAGPGARDHRSAAARREPEELAPGPALPIVERLLAPHGRERGAEIVLLSRQRPDAGLAVLETLRRRGLAIERTVFTAGASCSRYLRAFEVELLLTLDEGEAQEAARSGTTAVLVLPRPSDAPIDPIRVALDLGETSPAGADDASGQDEALEQLAGLVRRLRGAAEVSGTGLHTALLSSRGASDQAQTIRSLGRCGLQADEAFSLAGLPREAVLQAFGAQLLLDARHLAVASEAKPEAATGSGPRAESSDRDDSRLDTPFSRLRFRG